MSQPLSYGCLAVLARLLTRTAQQLSTCQPWSASLPSPQDESPYSAHVLVKHSSSGYRPPPSTISPISSVSSRPCPFLRPPDVVTAALDSRLHFWVWEAPDAAPAGDVEAAASGSEAAGSGASGLSQALQDRAGFARSVSGGAKHYCSHPQSGHTAVIDVLLDVPAVEGCFG